MAFVTVKHSTTAYKLIMRELSLFKRILNILIQTVFFAYYIYLLVTKIDSLGYTISYAILLAVMVASIIIELSMRGKSDETKNEKKKRKHNKAKIDLVVKIIKYLAKVATIVLAVIDIALHGGSDLSIILIAVSTLLLIVQITADIVFHFLKRYFTMMYYAVKMDLEQSEGVQYVTGLYHKMKGDEDAPKEIEEPYLTESEKKTIELIKEQSGDYDVQEMPVETKKKKKGFFAKMAEKAIIKAGSKALNQNKEK